MRSVSTGEHAEYLRVRALDQSGGTDADLGADWFDRNRGSTAGSPRDSIRLT